MNIKVTVNFFKVIVDERHFADQTSADAYMQTLKQGLVGVLVEV